MDKVITVEAIMELVAARYKIRVDDLKAKKRTRSIAYPRQIAMYLTRELTDLSLPRIGECFGGRDHTTVLHACDKIADDKKSDANLERQLAKLTDELKKISRSAPGFHCFPVSYPQVVDNLVNNLLVILWIT